MTAALGLWTIVSWFSGRGLVVIYFIFHICVGASWKREHVLWIKKRIISLPIETLLHECPYDSLCENAPDKKPWFLGGVLKGWDGIHGMRTRVIVRPLGGYPVAIQQVAIWKMDENGPFSSTIYLLKWWCPHSYVKSLISPGMNTILIWFLGSWLIND